MRNDWLDNAWLMDKCHLPITGSPYLSTEQAKLISQGTAAYIYGYPLVLMTVTKNIMLAGGAELNQFVNARNFPTPSYSTIVRPNVDTLYSMAWLDLANEPVILSVPETQGRYYLMEFLDAWTNVFASIGARTTGTKKQTFIITGPLWNGLLPEGVTRIQAPTNTVWIIGRTQTNGPQDYPAVHAIQNNFLLIPLNHWGTCTGPGKLDSAAPLSVDPVEIVSNMDAATFFQTMLSAMDSNPSWLEDPAMQRKLSALDLVTSQPFVFSRLSPAVRYALEIAAANGPELLKAAAAQKYAQSNIGGWLLILKDIGFYGVDYTQRAVVALTGIGANLPQDSVYGSVATDADGMPLMGYRNYRIHFEKWQVPPVNAFWSLTAYNQNGYLVKNPLGRYAVSPHFGGPNYNADDSLDILIGSDWPPTSHASNWLPVSEGPFNLVLRMYWPKSAVLSGRWKPPAISRL